MLLARVRRGFGLPQPLWSYTWAAAAIRSCCDPITVSGAARAGTPHSHTSLQSHCDLQQQPQVLGARARIPGIYLWQCTGSIMPGEKREFIREGAGDNRAVATSFRACIP